MELQQSRVVVSTMHQGQHSSLPNCEVVQRGVKLLRLDCAAGGSKEAEGREEGTERRRSGGTGWADRGEETQRQTCSPLVPEHFILLSFLSSFP